MVLLPLAVLVLMHRLLPLGPLGRAPVGTAIAAGGHGAPYPGTEVLTSPLHCVL